MAARLWLPVALVAALLAQLLSGFSLRALRPALEEFPPPPSSAALTAMAFGDPQFLFRAAAMWLQDFGDGGGRVKPLRDFDYERVAGWLRALDRLDRRSDAIYLLGSQYYGALTDPGTAAAKVKLIAEFFEQAGIADPAGRWPWLVWAAVTNQRLSKDPALARKTAWDLMSLKDDKAVPYWLPLLALPLFRLAGDQAQAERLMADPDMLARRNRSLRELKELRPQFRPN